MAKYTLEIRDIVESLNIELFDFEYEYYADNYALQKRFERMFTQHYYFHEIGAETVERFKWMLRARLNLNAPKYKQYWDSYLRTKDIDFAVNKDYIETVTRELESENTSSSISNRNSTSSNTSNSVSSNATKTSSLGDGVSKARLDEDYVTAVAEDTGNTSSNDKHDANEANNSNTDSTGKQRETNTLHAKGNIGSTSSARLIQEWRDIMLNLDRQLIEDCADLFMQIY